ncbi:MAG: hypothetical protein ACT4PJ_07100 [Gemmatimonadaceae bacterium]
MNIAVQIEPTGTLSDVVYRWDTDTDILTATLRNGAKGTGMSGSVELAGSDGSWVILDVEAGCIHGVEVAVWPDVRKVPTLNPPADAQSASVIVPTRRSQPDVAAVEVDASLIAEADQAERTIHFRLGVKRPARAVRFARDLLLELDDRDRIAGLWLLNVPPFPEGE